MRRSIGHAAIPAYFVIRIASALLLLKLSTAFLTVQGFADFVQFLAFASLLNVAVIGGAQNGLIREAAAASQDELSDVHGAGLAIWAAAVPLIGVPIAIFSGEISHILTGSTAYWHAVIAIAALSLAAGPGQVCWSLLSGRRRVVQSLGAQTLGILAATTAASWCIVRGSFVGAALAFASGPLVGTFVALLLVARWPLKWRATTRRIRPLLGYSASMTATLGFTSLTLFALRSIYREHFGTTQLGYWLAANRISDMSTQFLGLLMLQGLVPQLAIAAEPRERLALIVRYGAVGAALTGIALLVFLAAGRPLVLLFLSDAYLPAIPSIRLYMAGDFLRVWVSLAMFAAFAAGRPGQYAIIEISTVAVMAALTLLLVESGEVLAPQMGYAAAYAITVLLLAAAWLLRFPRMPQGLSQRRGGRRISLQGTAPRPR